MAETLNVEQELDAALAHQDGGRLDLAEAGYRTVLRLVPDELDALNLLAVVVQERGDLAASIELLARAIAIDPNFPEALTNLARAQRAAGDPTAAADAARRAVELDPELAEAHLQLGHALFDLADDRAATSALARAAVLAPDSMAAFHQLGKVWLRLKDYQAAADALHMAVRLEPGRTDVMVSLGVALAGLERLDEALAWHQKAAALAPDDATTHAALAVTQRRRLDAAGSIAACRRLLELAPGRTDIWLLLGANLAASGRFEEAEACYRQVLSLDPSSVEARRDLAMINRQSHDVTEMERLRAALDDPASSPAEKIAAGFGLGTLLDRIDDHDVAFAALATANRLTHAALGAGGQSFDAAGLHNYVDWAIKTFTKDTFAAATDWGDMSERPVFIVGMPRSGTSLVEQIAASHPGVFGAGECRDVREIVRPLLGEDPPRPPAAWDRATVRQAAIAHVARLGALGGAVDRVIDKMPDNILLLGAIAVLFPRARIIICRRDLRDVGLSCFLKPFTDGMVWAFDLAETAARAREIERLTDHWRAVLPLRMLEVVYEDLVADLEGQSRRLIDFLGLEWDPACLAFHETERTVMTASFWQVRQTLYTTSIGRWRRYRKHLGPLFLGLADVVPPETEDDWDAAVADPAAARAAAVRLHRAGRLDVAEPIYRALLRRDPDDAAALHLLGLLLIGRGEPVQAIGLIARSLELRPDVSTALADLARAHRVSGDAEAATQWARKAIDIDPELTDAHVQLGGALMLAQDYAGAVDAFMNATALDPRSVQASVGLAAALAKTQNLRAAADARRTAVALKPDDPELLIDFAGALGDLGRFDEALPILRRALALSPNHQRAQYGIAYALVHINDAAGGIEVCRQALEAAPDSVEFLGLLANCHTVLGQFDEAAEVYRRVLAIDPTATVAMSSLAGIGKQLTEYVPPELPSTVLRDAARPVRQRIAAGFAEGRNLDRLGDYDAAFEAYSLANKLLRDDRAAKGFVFDRQHQHAMMDWLIANIGPETFVQTAGWGNRSELPVFVVGLPRSGTTLVEQIAASHPRVFGAGEAKGVNEILVALDGEQAITSPTGWDRKIVDRETAAHVARLQGLGGEAVRVVDKLPGNILWLGQLAILFPRARIVVCRRDLRDVGLSCYFQYFEENALVWTDDLGDCGVYARQTERVMRHWRQVLPYPILEIQYETLVANLESESRRLIEFLGLDWDPACLAFHETDRAVLTASHWQVRQPIYATSVGRWRNYQNHLGPMLDELGPLAPGDSGA